MPNYRIPLIPSEIYRLWARIRSKQLNAWADRWIPDNAYSAGPGAGAIGAHYQLAAASEHATITKQSFAGRSTDLSKCFDRVLREIIKPMAIRMGFPHQIYSAYESYNNNMILVYCL